MLMEDRPWKPRMDALNDSSQELAWRKANYPEIEYGPKVLPLVSSAVCVLACIFN